MNPYDQFIEPPRAPPGSIGGLVVQKKRAPLAPLAEPIAEANLARARQQIEQDRATEAARIRKANADADKAESEARRSATESGAPVDPALANAIKGLGLDELLASVNAARREIGRGTATGVTGAVMRRIPGSTANDLAGSLESIQGAVILEKLQALKEASKTGASGMGALSEREGARLAASVAAIGTNLSDDKLREGLATIERHALALKAVGNGENPENPEVAKKYGLSAERPNTRRDESVTTPSRDGNQTMIDPTLTGANKRVSQMIKQGKSADEVRSYLETVRPGLSGEVQNIDAWVNYHRQKPNEPINALIDRVNKPLTPVASLVNTAAQSGPGAMVMGAADMLSGGTLDNLSDNPALARAGMAGVAEESPWWNLAGQTAGAVGAGIGAEATAARLGIGKIGSVLAGDALPGIAYGAGSADDGSRIGGALIGGGAGIAGGLGGRAIGRGISGVADAGAKRLNDAGVRMTVPQMLGGGYKGLEDRMSGLPGFRGMINGARTQGLEDANRAVFRESVVAPVAAIPSEQIGEAGINNLADVVDGGYNQALGGKVVQIDQPFTQQWGMLSQTIPGIPRVGPDVQAAIAANVGPMFQGGRLSGESMQAVDRGLGDLKSKYVDDPLFATHIAPAIDAANDAVSGLFRRQTPEVMPAYDAAKATYRNLSTVSDAVNAGINTDGMFTAAQLGTAARGNAKKYGSAISAAKGNRPFFELQRDMQNIMPSKVPDPGTAGQMVIPGALAVAGGLGGGAANADGSASDMASGGGAGILGGLALAGALASPYAARGALQRILMAPRGPILQNAGEVVGRSRLPGALALPLLSTGQ